MGKPHLARANELSKREAKRVVKAVYPDAWASEITPGHWNLYKDLSVYLLRDVPSEDAAWSRAAEAIQDVQQPVREIAPGFTVSGISKERSDELSARLDNKAAPSG
jgi:hypothetical protein